MQGEVAMPKVLSIRQPWASMIVRGLKRFEIRTWSTPYRGQLLIHASSATPTRAFADEAFEEYPELGELMAKVGICCLDDLRALPRSAIVGAVMLTEVMTSEALKEVATVDDATIIGRVDGENFYWLLTDSVEIEPVSGVNGKLNLWTLPAKIESTVLERISRGTPASFKSNEAGGALAEWFELPTDEDDDDEEVDSAEDNRLVVPSPDLAAIIGTGPVVRADVIKRLWDYIEKHGLQDATNRRMINADDKFRKVMGRSKIDMFKMSEKLALHLSEA